MSALTCGLGATAEGDLASLKLGGHPIDCDAGGLQGGDLGGVLAHPQGAHHLAAAHIVGTARAGRRPVAEQVDQEPRPHRVADSDPRRLRDQTGEQGHRVLGLVPRAQGEHAWLLDHPWRLKPWDDQDCIVGPGHHQHRQPFQGHRLVTGQVGQVAAHRHQQHVDTGLAHAGAGPSDAVEVDRCLGDRCH